MANENLTKKSFSFPSCSFDDGAVCAKIEFGQADNVELATIGVDGKVIGICALNSMGARDVAYCPIDRTEGTHDVTVTVENHAVIYDISFLKTPAYAQQPYTPIPEESICPIDADTWEAVDMLGRPVASVEDVGPKSDRKVGIFYWTWHQLPSRNLRPVDVVDVLAKYPAAEYRHDHPAWGERPFQCFWHEPLYGFYQDVDPYVIRHHMTMLRSAGVDFLLFDCTNGALLWRAAYEPLFAEMRRMRADGVDTPKVAFMLNFWPNKDTERMLRALYQNLYAPGLYSDLWFYLDGKPMIMGSPETLPEIGCTESDTQTLNEIRSFFTFRPGQPGYGCGPSRPDHWGWLEIFPQHKYGERPDGSCEMMTVGVAQNANKDRICTHFNDKDTFGRSYTKKHGFKLLDSESYKYGYNVQEQWERVLDIRPDIAFVTGWNEWIMGQFHEPWLSDNDSTQLAMVDQYDREHSRDIEPDRDGYLDTYYLQLCSNIRRFKGATPRQPISAPKTICMDGSIEQWDDVTPKYVCDKGTTIHRDHDGFVGCHYVNTSGRNDMIAAKVARDAKFVYFYAECAEELTQPSKNGWMSLFLDTDRSKQTGWEGYDYIVNRTAPISGKTTVERYVRTVDEGSFTWETVAEAEIVVNGNTLVIAVPRTVAGLDGTLDFEFKWSDNMQTPDVMDFYVNGDTAPIGRFNYLYREKK
ncbi:MAG: hypothetical protein E7452_00720 [Ruminococcaceae bacterium]|nr:hypothetical protein [Oscillospiraceae bacterium]